MRPNPEEAKSMSTSDAVIERVRVREAAGVFRSREALEAAAEALRLAGFDRADIDILADADAVRRKLRAPYIAAEDLADVPHAPRRAFMAREDVALAVSGIAGILIYIGATVAALAILSTGGARAWATVVAVGIAAAGGIGASVVIRFLERQQAEQLDRNTIADGLILWVRVRSPDREERAQQILREWGGQAIRVHEIEIDKRLEDLPLSNLRPDPWLGGERLGHL
jgi:hypothetical protein